MDSCTEILAKCPQDKDQDKKKALREEFAAGWMKSAFDRLEQDCSETGFMFGDTVTCGDITLYYYILAMIRSGQFVRSMRRVRCTV